MKRTINLVVGDIRFQLKYGFYVLYAFFTLLYIAVLYIFPAGWKADASSIIIFSDPALLGMIFTGVLVLFEKSERVINSIAVSPVKTSEYLLSKAFTLGLISLLTGLILGVTAGSIHYPVRFVLALFFGSWIFTWMGLLVSTKINTLNQYVMSLIPMLIVVTSPVITYQFFNPHPAWLLHPGVAIFELMNNITEYDLMAGVSIVVWLFLTYSVTQNQFSKMLKKMGGAKL